MANRKRNIRVVFTVDENEMEIINKKMELQGIASISNYMREMAINGKLLNFDMRELTDYTRQLSAIGNNINQIAKKVNMNGNIRNSELDELVTDYKKVKANTEKIYAEYSLFRD